MEKGIKLGQDADAQRPRPSQLKTDDERVIPYANNYPALPPVADADAQAILQGTAAPAIAAGAPLSDDLLVRVIYESHAREIVMGLTAPEVILARKRYHAILHEHAMAEYNALALALPPGAPAWLGPVITAAVTAAMIPLMNQMTALTNRVDAIQTGMNRMRNELLQSKNVDIFRNRTRQRLHRYFKLDNATGLGLPLRGMVLNVIPVAVGTQYPITHFPTTIRAINTMTAQRMHELSIMMNNDFGVVARDRVTTCRTKLRDYLLFGDI